jgi:putrescine transport system permease protein
MKKLLEKHFGKFWIFIVFLFLYLPLAYMIFFSFNASKNDFHFTGFSLRWYDNLFESRNLVNGFLLSLKVALLSGLLSATLGTMVAFVLVRYQRFWGRTLFAGLSNAPLVLPEVLLGLSLLLFFSGIKTTFGIGSMGYLPIVLGHTLMGAAYAMVVIQSRLLELNPSYEEVAMDLGAKPIQVFFLVILPNIYQAIVAAFLLVIFFFF